jgi:D-inositol-3-phosphate glycosyltransferase
MLSIHSSPLGKLGTQDTGGMSVYIRELAGELGKRGHHIDIYTKQSDALLPQFHDLGKHVRLIHLSVAHADAMSKLGLYPHLSDFFNQIKAIVKKEDRRYDLVHSHYWLSGKIGSWAQRTWRCPHVTTFHTLAAIKNKVNAQESEPEVRRLNEKQLVDRSDKIIVSSRREKQFLMQHYAADPQKVAVISCGVNLSLFRPLDKNMARRQLGFRPHENLVLYVGRFVPVKGLERLLAAIAHLNQANDLRLLVIGGDGPADPASQHIEQVVDQMGIQQQVRFLGRIDQTHLPAYYSAADVLALPSDYESFGLVCLEALACGTPVVATPVGAVEKFITGSEFGAIVDSKTPEALAKGIQRVLSQSPRRANLPSIRTSVLACGWSDIAGTLANEYLRVLQQHHAPDGYPSQTSPVACVNDEPSG